MRDELGNTIDIDTKGQTINIKANATVNISSTGVVNITAPMVNINSGGGAGGSPKVHDKAPTDPDKAE